MRTDELRAELQGRRFRSVYLVLGPEARLRRKALDLLREAVLPPEAMAFNLTEFDGASAAMADVVAAANTFPMLASHRLVVVRDLRALDASETEALREYIRAPQLRTVLALSVGELDRRTTFAKLLLQQAGVVEADKLKGAALERWAADRIRAQGGRIGPQALRRVVELAGSDLDVLASEIDKLLLYASGGGEITDGAVEDLVRNSRHAVVFELTGALGRGDRPAALRILSELFDSGEPSLKILAMLARHYRQILIVKDLARRGRSAADIGAAAQVPPYLRDEFLRQARSIDGGVAEATFLRLAEADRRFKSTGADHRMLLERLIAAL